MMNHYNSLGMKYRLQTYLSLGPRLKRDSGWVGGVINSSIIRRGNVMNEEATFKNLKKLFLTSLKFLQKVLLNQKYKRLQPYEFYVVYKIKM